jgi:anti-sigma-K factor RskA
MSGGVPGPGHDRWADATGAYLLGALPPEDAEGFERHLAACPVCSGEVEELRVAADALPASAPPVAAPAALRARIMAVVESEAELLSAVGERADRPPEREEGRRRRGLLGGLFERPALAAGLAALTLVVGGVAGALVAGGGGDGAHPRTVPAQMGHGMGGATVALRIDASGQGMLVGRHLPPPPRGRIYQVWLLKAGARNPVPTSALFGVRRDGSAQVAVPGRLAGGQTVLVTHEPLGGSDAPTRAPILSIATSS